MNLRAGQEGGRFGADLDRIRDLSFLCAAGTHLRPAGFLQRQEVLHYPHFGSVASACESDPAAVRMDTQLMHVFGCKIQPPGLAAPDGDLPQLSFRVTGAELLYEE
jgi:hypothetical protein